MSKKTTGLPQDLKDWVEARARHHLSHAHVQMARELGMSPKKLGKLDNHRQEPWKAPLPQFIEELYLERFGRERPQVVKSIEERARAKRAKQAAHKAAKRRAQAQRQREAAAQAAIPSSTEHSQTPQEPDGSADRNADSESSSTQD
ncbi:MAG: hypothetical protein IT378_03790 [Sandaracinaceae bacterium]|nr:hypothetical protein [Sandaracinaceae bacterium]